MDSISSEVYQTPALLSLICIMSAMTFVLSAYYWFWLVIRNPEKTEVTFSKIIWLGQFYNFLFVMILSIFIGIYDSYMAARPLQIGGELSILALSLFASSKFQKGKTLKHIKIVISVGFTCFIGWGITFGLWLAFSQIFKITSVMAKEEFDVMIIFAAGLLWNLPIIIMFQKILKNDNMRSHLKGLGIHKFIWPVMIAYLVLLAPLMIQDTVNSEEWKKMENAKPIRKI